MTITSCKSKQRETKSKLSLIPHFFCFDLLMLHLVTFFSPQMPQVMDSNSKGIDLHFWGQVLKAVAEQIQVVSAPKSIYLFPRSCSPLLLFSPAGSEVAVFLAPQETRLFLCSLFENRSRRRRLSDGLNNVRGRTCVCAHAACITYKH